LFRVARPSGEQRVSMAQVVLPFAVALVIAGVSLGFAPEADWRAMILGTQWSLCFLCIPLNAILPFAAIIIALRQFAAPTHLHMGRGACRAHRPRHQCGRLCNALQGRLVCVHRRVVWSHDSHVHADRGFAGTKAAPVVTRA
jgi:hypothetical protein